MRCQYRQLSVSYRSAKNSWPIFRVNPEQLDDFSDGTAQRPTGIPGEFQPSFNNAEALVNVPNLHFVQRL
ncbi:hypothetical protein [Aestuariibacter sp. A3R04]|uniref:hypothetical protein n=1 Tax=Aestuariibacter sp. A3R04 TaxID=2841571 RepID=UPI001C099A0F|nr:hypothetical protein [Aestuariibacter sp. A3R04]MBU3020492.1 hypothetical protein [Aestuariibacter sp. A3R04]